MTLYQKLRTYSNLHIDTADTSFRHFVDKQEKLLFSNTLASEVAENILTNLGYPLVENYDALTEILISYKENTIRNATA